MKQLLCPASTYRILCIFISGFQNCFLLSCHDIKWGDTEVPCATVMDPPDRPNGLLQRQDAKDDDLPKSLNATHIYKGLDFFPGYDLYEKASSGLIIPTEPQQPKLAETADQQRTYRPVPVRPPPPPPRGRLPSAFGPPPVPPRTRAPINKTRFSFELTEPAHKLTRSRTQVDSDVSKSARVSMTKFSIYYSTSSIFPPPHQDPFTIKLRDTPEGSSRSLASLCASTSK